jgi:ribosomal protein S18 acetylase RimI-like enzyme
MLFVPAALRGRGIGSALVCAAERAARARGCIGMQVNRFDFQAGSLYERLGFKVFGVQQDLPPGRRCFFLSKRIDPAQAAYADARMSDGNRSAGGAGDRNPIGAPTILP